MAEKANFNIGMIRGNIKNSLMLLDKKVCRGA
jgi:hypothetical protein